MKRLLTFAVIAGVLVFAWLKLPGLRHKTTEAIEGFGGWTEEARNADPVGFIEFAEGRLGEDLTAFERARVDLGAARAGAETELENSRERLAAASRFADEFRQAFQTAESAGAYPVTVRGSKYGRDELVEQVGVLLFERDNYTEIIGDFERVLAQAEAKALELSGRIKKTSATLVSLKSKKEIARIDALTGEADDLMAKVGELLGENAAARKTGDTPVRTVEELMQAKGETATSAPSHGSEQALAYLQGGA